jgi:hypothetical protein
MPQETKSTMPVEMPAIMQGMVVDAGDEPQLRHAIDLAFDYRGDVSITRKSSGETIEGYVFDRRSKPSLADSIVRIIPGNGTPRIAFPYSDIASLKFTGRDTAAGKSFETWMKKYVQKKLAGESASLESEPLDET